MSSFGVVLDACVLICAPVRDTLLRAATLDLYQPHWSSDILDEVLRNLVKDLRVSVAQADHLINEMCLSFPDAEVTDYRRIIDHMTNHPKDRHVIAAAITAPAPAIVTFNLRDFPPKSLTPHEVEAKHPDTFLCDSLFDSYPDALSQIVIDQAANLKRPPMSVMDLLTILERHVPLFAQSVRQFLVDERRE